MGICNKIEYLRVDFQEIAKFILNKAPTYGFKLVVNETKRSQDVQTAYFKQGRRPLDEVNKYRKIAGLWATNESENKKIITNVVEVNTKDSHGAGLAMDVVPNGDWGCSEKLQKLIWQLVQDANEYYKTYLESKNASIIWGGNWKSIYDWPHIEMKFKA